MAYGRSNDVVVDDVMWPWKVKVVMPIFFRPVISKTARDRDSVLTGHHLPPQPYIKALKKFTWQIYALSERLLVNLAVKILILMCTATFLLHGSWAPWSKPHCTENRIVLQWVNVSVIPTGQQWLCTLPYQIKSVECHLTVDTAVHWSHSRHAME